MTERVPLGNGNLLRQLRRIRILVIHPDDSEREMFLAHLKRVGCQVESVWPAPECLPDYVDVVFFVINRIHNEKSLTWMATSESIARIAIIAFETPEILAELQRMNVHGVISKPIRIFGILAALTTALGLANHENRLKMRIKSLDETLKARRKIEKAVAVLSRTRNITEEEAYKRLRDKAMQTNMSIATIADAIIATDGI